MIDYHKHDETLDQIAELVETLCPFLDFFRNFILQLIARLQLP